MVTERQQQVLDAIDGNNGIGLASTVNEYLEVKGEHGAIVNVMKRLVKEGELRELPRMDLRLISDYWDCYVFLRATMDEAAIAAAASNLRAGADILHERMKMRVEKLAYEVVGLRGAIFDDEPTTEDVANSARLIDALSRKRQSMLNLADHIEHHALTP